MKTSQGATGIRSVTLAALLLVPLAVFFVSLSGKAGKDGPVRMSRRQSSRPGLPALSFVAWDYYDR